MSQALMASKNNTSSEEVSLNNLLLAPHLSVATKLAQPGASSSMQSQINSQLKPRVKVSRHKSQVSKSQNKRN